MKLHTMNPLNVESTYFSRVLVFSFCCCWMETLQIVVYWMIQWLRNLRRISKGNYKLLNFWLNLVWERCFFAEHTRQEDNNNVMVKRFSRISCKTSKMWMISLMWFCSPQNILHILSFVIRNFVSTSIRLSTITINNSILWLSFA